MTISRELRDLGAAAAFSALLFATGVLVPLLGPPAGFFSAAPLIWVAARHGSGPGLLGGLLGAALLLPVLPPPVVLIYAIEHAAPAGFLGWRLRAGRGIVAGSALAAVLVTLLVTGAALLFVGRGQDPAALFEQQLREGLTELRGAAADGATLPVDVDRFLAVVRRVLPALTLIGIFLECALNALLAARALAVRAPAVPPPQLGAFALPEWLVWILIPVLALCWAPQPPLATAALNAALPLLFVYLIQGCSILLHLAARAHLTRFGRTLAAVAFLLFPWLLAGPLLLGLTDFRFNYRRRWPLA